MSAIDKAAMVERASRFTRAEVRAGAANTRRYAAQTPAEFGAENGIHDPAEAAVVHGTFAWLADRTAGAS